MSRLSACLASGRSLLWLESTDYAAQLLAGGRPPWSDVAATLAWLRKSQGLLRSDVIAVPVAALVQGLLAERPALRAAMAAKQRLLAPLKALLADEALRAHLLELLRGLRAGYDEAPLVLQLPSPRLWPALAHRQAFGDGDAALEVGDDDADSAAVYVADFLRHYGDAGIDALLLEETEASTPRSADDLALYQPVINVAAHYRWSLGLLTPRAPAFDAAALDYLIAPGGGHAPALGALLGDEFWQTGDAPAAPLRYARVPPGLQPEAVLDRIAGLR